MTTLAALNLYYFSGMCSNCMLIVAWCHGSPFVITESDSSETESENAMHTTVKKIARHCMLLILIDKALDHSLAFKLCLGPCSLAASPNASSPHTCPGPRLVFKFGLTQ